jgi:carboxymethylenebutenolidase
MQLAYSSRGKDIHVDVVRPATNEDRPAIVVLHGSGGARDFPRNVQELTARGYVAVAPHYFESTGTSWADLDSIRRHGLTWGHTVLEAVEFARRLPNVDGQAIGTLGFSLGAYLAVAAAAHDRRIKCLVEFFGGAPEKFLPSLDHLPPTLILHGSDDIIVPVRHAMRLRQLCEENNFYYEMEIYHGAGHSFDEPLMQTAMERAISFLDRYLRTPQSEAVSYERACDLSCTPIEDISQPQGTTCETPTQPARH